MRFVGKSFPIHDAKAKAAGKALYAGDMKLTGMQYAAILFSPVPHAIVKAVNMQKALEAKDVTAVLHCFNTTGRTYNRYRTVKGQQVIEQERIFQSHLRFIGDRVACVVAKTPEAAKAALKLIEVEYEELPFTTDMHEARSGNFDAIHKGGAVCDDTEFEFGDRGKIAAETVETMSRSYLSRISHVTMEPHACVASYDKYAEQLTIWSPNQSVYGIRTLIGDLFGLPYRRIRVIKTTMGGSFGAKQEWILEPVAAAAALAVDAPVRLVYSRAEAMLSTVARCPIDAGVKSKFTRDGKLQSLSIDLTLDAGAYLSNSYDYAVAIASKFFRCYAYPHAAYRARVVCTNTPVSGAFRGWSSPEMCIMLEHHLNMAARKLGIDPLELRLKNIALPGDVDLKTKQPLGEIRTRESILKGRELFEWDAKKLQTAWFNQENKRFKRGIAISCGGHLNGYFPRFPDFAGAGMRITETGDVIVDITLHDHGCGTVTAMKIIVAEVLGIPMERVCIGEGDTGHTPFDVGCYASRTTFVIGRAAAECAELLKARLAKDIAEIHQLDENDIVVADGMVKAKNDAGIAYTYGEAATTIFKTLQKEVWVQHQYVNDSNPGVSGTHFAMVEVDTYTGMVRILDYLAIHDIGRVINREMCIAQIQGAVLMGSGAALTEHMRPDPSTGRVTSSLKDYHLLNAYDAPNIRVEFIEDGGAKGPFEAKSIGEVSHVPVAPAVIGAVNDALQSDLCAIPLNPDTIVAEIAKRRKDA